MTTFHLIQKPFHVITPIEPRGYLLVDGVVTDDGLFGIDFTGARAWPYDGLWGKGWLVTHIPSARGLGPLMKERAECVGFIEQIKDLTDWSVRDPDMSGVPGEAIATIVAQYQSGEGAAMTAWTELADM